MAQEGRRRGRRERSAGRARDRQGHAGGAGAGGGGAGGDFARYGRRGGSWGFVGADRGDSSRSAEAERRSAKSKRALRSASENRPSTSPGTNEVEARLSPSVRRACQQHGIDPSRIEGTGRGGRVTREDVDRAVAAATTVQVGEASHRPAAPLRRRRHPARPHAAQDRREHGPRRRRPAARHRGVRGRLLRHRRAQGGACRARDEAQLHRLHRQGRGRGDGGRAGDQRPLGGRPHRHLADDRHRRRHRARRQGADRPGGQGRGRLSLEQIGAKLDDLTARARSGALKGADVSGGSFTISNHGVSGSLLAAPIILHQGQAAILGVGKLEKRVVVREIGGQDAILVRPMAYVTLTIDHRVVDGHQTNAWLQPVRGDYRRVGRRPARHESPRPALAAQWAPAAIVLKSFP